MHRVTEAARMPSDDVFSSMIAGLRDAGLTTARIAAESNISRQTLWRLETGDSRMPSHQSFDRLALVCRRHGLSIPGPSHRR
jgi:transcriptional regulator with XRE-family HTH domain